MNAETKTPEDLRREADRLEEKIRYQRVREIRREFAAVRKQSRGNPDLAARFAGIAEAARLAKACPTLEGVTRNSILTWIELEAEELEAESISGEGLVADREEVAK